MLTIRNFHHNPQFANIAEVKQALMVDFLGKSVTIEYRKPSGIKTCVWVDVAPDGQVSESYGDCKLLDWDALAEQVGITG